MRLICEICGIVIDTEKDQYYMWWNSNYTYNFFCTNCVENPMPKATLSYEALQLDQDGIPTEGAYRLKLEGHFKRNIEPIVKWIKATIPANSDRTFDPTTYEWSFIEKWLPIVETALKGAGYSITFTIRKDDFVELKRKQAEWAKQAGQTFQTKTYDTDQDLELFGNLIAATNYTNGHGYKNWSREEAIAAYKKAIKFYHPDLHPERAEQASSLNEVWSRLKEGYYIK